MKIRRALLSTYDKTGIVPLAQTLISHGVEIISTGGTRAALEDADLPVTDIRAVTGSPEAFGGRMKTISFQIASALLYERDRDAEEASRLGIQPIDLVVCNLYPFEPAVSRGAAHEELIELVDIGGPTMVRAAAKNYRYVGVVVDPSDYPALIAELDERRGALATDTRARLMRKAFQRIADYDQAIAAAMAHERRGPDLELAYADRRRLRYGENAHQDAWLYREQGAARSIADMRVLGGKPLSYNNLLDLAASLEAVSELPRAGVAIVKHNNPCGLADAEDQRVAFEAAWDGDPLSAFGSVIAFNQPLTLETARFLSLDAPKARQRKFVEVVAAPEIPEEVVAYLASSANLRVVAIDPRGLWSGARLRPLPGALLVQSPDDRLVDELRWATEARPADGDLALLHFGVGAVRQIRSNAIALVRRRADGVLQLLGMGAGQPNRLDATRLCLARARENLARELAGAEAPEAAVREELGRAALISDAFFPFPDNIEACAEAGVRLIYQPGGSIRDKAVVRACDKHGVAMAMTGVRHFKH
jgi:phosphoribosylaminoimidazolecarboxamide formyltransferase / IMP cyclohydrolase